jgi:two-component system probable response regulator PhcQ
MSTGYDYRKFAILFVDDEEQALKYFAKAYEKDFRILTAPSVADAQTIIKREGDSIGVVITDQRMPGKTGVDLLGELRRTRPSIIRILTTAYSDIDSAIDAVNSGAIYKYIVKPWNLRDLRGILLRAMEFFLVQRERDMLLRQKLHVIQRLVITDRVRSLAALAAGLSHHIRNSMMALKSFLDLAPMKLQEELLARTAKSPEFWEDLWGLAQRESQQILQMVQKVAETVVTPSYTFADEIDLGQLIRSGVDQGASQAGHQDQTVIELASGLPRVKVDANMAKRLFAILTERTIGLNRSGGTIVVRAKAPVPIWDTQGIQIVFSGEGPAWTDEDAASLFTAFAPSRQDPRELGLDLLSAFFIAYHHGGEINVHKSAPLGPGFELILPFSPDAVQRPDMHVGFLEKLFLRFDAMGGDDFM